MCVCVSVGCNCELCENSQTDRDAIWDINLSGPKELCIRGEPRSPPLGEETVLGGAPKPPCDAAFRHNSSTTCSCLVNDKGWLGSRVVSMLDLGAEGPAFKSQLRRCLRQTAHTHRASVHQAVKLEAALLRVARVTVGLAESNGSLPLGL